MSRLLAAIARQRNALIDWEITATDARAALDRELVNLQIAVRERDRAARYLTFLIELADDMLSTAQRLRDRSDG